jgi:hypothetical protein
MVKRQRFVEVFFLDPLLCMLATLRKASISFVISVSYMEQLEFQWTDFHEIWYLSIEYLSRKFTFYLHLTRRSRTCCENTCTCMKTTLWILLIMRNISNRICGKMEAQISSLIHPPPENCVIYDMINIKCTIALPLQQWSRKPTTILRSTYIAYLSLAFRRYMNGSESSAERHTHTHTHTHIHDVISSFPVDFTPPNVRQTAYSLAKLFCEACHIQLARS